MQITRTIKSSPHTLAVIRRFRSPPLSQYATDYISTGNSNLTLGHTTKHYYSLL